MDSAILHVLVKGTMLQIFEEKTHSPTLELIEMWFEEVSSGHSLWSFLRAQLHALYCYSIRHMTIFTYQFRCDSSLLFCFIVFRNAIKASFLSESAGCCRETSFSGANSPRRKRHCVDDSEKDALFYRFWSTEITGCFNCHCCRWKQKKKENAHRDSHFRWDFLLINLLCISFQC